MDTIKKQTSIPADKVIINWQAQTWLIDRIRPGGLEICNPWITLVMKHSDKTDHHFEFSSRSRLGQINNSVTLPAVATRSLVNLDLFNGLLLLICTRLVHQRADRAWKKKLCVAMLSYSFHSVEDVGESCGVAHNQKHSCDAFRNTTRVMVKGQQF